MILHNLIYMFFGVNEIPPKKLGLTEAIELYPVITEIFLSDFTSTTTTGHRNRAHFGGTRPQKSKGYVLADVWGRFGVSLANKINQNDELCEEDTHKQCFNQDSAMTSWMHLATDMAYTPLAGMCYNIRVDANNIN